MSKIFNVDPLMSVKGDLKSTSCQIPLLKKKMAATCLIMTRGNTLIK